MLFETTSGCVAFNGTKLLSAGELPEVAVAAKSVLDQDKEASILIFHEATSEVIEVDFRGTAEDVLGRLVRPSEGATRSAQVTDAEVEGVPARGRPKLGVVAREVTLLPRHWDWLNSQPGGASVALRKLVEEARKAGADRDRRRLAQESCYRFMSAMAGDLPGFEEATRALFAGNAAALELRTASWPGDIRAHVQKLAVMAM